MKYTNRLLGQHVDDGLIVHKVDWIPFNLLLCIFSLLHFKNVLVEKILQIFICIVDAKLLKTIFWKIFKSKNVQNGNKVLDGSS